METAKKIPAQVYDYAVNHKSIVLLGLTIIIAFVLILWFAGIGSACGEWIVISFLTPIVILGALYLKKHPMAKGGVELQVFQEPMAGNLGPAE